MQFFRRVVDLGFFRDLFFRSLSANHFLNDGSGRRYVVEYFVTDFDFTLRDLSFADVADAQSDHNRSVKQSVDKSC